MKRTIAGALLGLWVWHPLSADVAADAPMAFIESQIAEHTGRSGVYVLDRGEEAPSKKGRRD